MDTPDEPDTSLDADVTDVDTDIDTEAPDDVMPVPPAAPPFRRLLLAIVAALLVGAVGVVVWGVLYATVKREFVGISVLVALGVGYVIREVSRRSTLLTRILASLVTALVCVAGTVVGEVAYSAARLNMKFWPLLRTISHHTWTLLRHRTALQFAIYVAAIVIAFLAAGPKKPVKAKPEPIPAPPADEADVTESADPAMLPDEGQSAT